MQWNCNKFKIKPKYSIPDEPRPEVIDGDITSMMYRCNIIYKHGVHMVSGIGSCKRQAERNAAVHGLLWLDKHQHELRAKMLS